MRSATELAAAIRRRDLSPVEAVQAHIDRSERLDPLVNADLEVLAVASELEEALGGWIDPAQSPRGQTLNKR